MILCTIWPFQFWMGLRVNWWFPLSCFTGMGHTHIHCQFLENLDSQKLISGKSHVNLKKKMLHAILQIIFSFPFCKCYNIQNNVVQLYFWPIDVRPLKDPVFIYTFSFRSFRFLTNYENKCPKCFNYSSYRENKCLQNPILFTRENKCSQKLTTLS